MQHFSLIKIVLLAVSLSVGFSSKAIDEQYYQLADSADKAIEGGNWALAENLIMRALRLEPSAPGNVMLMSNLGIVQLKLDKTEASIQTLSDAIAAAPQSCTLLNNRARVYAALGRDDEAFADYSRVLEMDSASVKALFGRGMIALSRVDLVTAKHDLFSLEAVSPDSRETHIAMGALHSLLGEYEAAEVHYTALIESGATDEFYLGRAVCRIMTGNYSGAGEDLNAGMLLNPDNPDLYAQRAMLSKLTYRMADYDLDMRMARKLGYKEEGRK